MGAGMKLLGVCLAMLFLSFLAQSSPSRSQQKAKAACEGAKTQIEMNQCLASAYQKADQELNAQYAELRKKLESGDSGRLQAAQRAWIAYRDTNCAAATALYDGGSIQPAIRAGCLERATRARIAELHAVYDTGDR